MSDKDPARGEETRDDEIDKMSDENLPEDNAQSAPTDDDAPPKGPSVGDVFRAGM